MTQKSLYTVDGQKLTLHLHPGQTRAWDSKKRIVAVIAGSQSGKTSFAPLWLWREIMQRGPGDYVYVCPTFTLMEVKALPEFLNLFERTLNLGQFVRSPIRRFTLSPTACQAIFGNEPATPTQIYFGYAENPDSLESATYKAAVLDEAGQKSFKRDSWEAVQRRLALYEGRILIGTTPYSNAGWLRTEIYDRWLAGDQSIDFIRFASIMNPTFPRAEYERARQLLPGWKFRMFFNGEFERPAGLIYDCFDEPRHKTPRFKMPDTWQRYLGIDFGGVNTAAVFFAEEPNTGRLYLYREYKAGGRTAAEHAQALLAGEPMVPICIGGSKSEAHWRAEFQAAGLPVREPAITGPDSVEVGIDRVYGTIKRDELFVFDDLAGFLEEILTYSRELDANGEPTEKIEDKSSYHHLDACRYIIGWVRGGGVTAFEVPSDRDARPLVDTAPRGVFMDLDWPGEDRQDGDSIRWPWQ
jgi:hypothetical protein